MSLLPIRWYQPVILTKYPHIYGPDSDLMTTWIKNEGSKFKRIAYDIAVGGYREPPGKIDKALLSDWKYLASFKIDALAENDEVNFILEIKFKANFSALGQLLTYKRLWKKESDTKKVVKLGLVTSEINPTLKSIFEHYNIIIFIYPS